MRETVTIIQNTYPKLASDFRVIKVDYSSNYYLYTARFIKIQGKKRYF